MSFPIAHILLEAAFMTEDMIKIQDDVNIQEGWRYFNDKRNQIFITDSDDPSNTKIKEILSLYGLQFEDV